MPTYRKGDCNYKILELAGLKKNRSNIARCIWEVRHPNEKYFKGRKREPIAKNFHPLTYKTYNNCHTEALKKNKGQRKSAVMQCVWAYEGAERARRPRKKNPYMPPKNTARAEQIRNEIRAAVAAAEIREKNKKYYKDVEFIIE